MNKKLTFEEFLPHINTNCDHYQQTSDPLCVTGPLTTGFEVLALHHTVQTMPPGNIFEIGSWFALSTITLALTLKERFPDSNYKVITIDPHDHQHSMNTDPLTEYFRKAPENFSIHDIFLSNIKKWEVENFVVNYREFSEKFDPSKLADISMIFIDANHSEDAVGHDMRKYVPMLKQYGYLILHDKNMVGVQQAVMKYKLEFPNSLIEAYDDIKREGMNPVVYNDLIYVFKKVG